MKQTVKTSRVPALPGGLDSRVKVRDLIYKPADRHSRIKRSERPENRASILFTS